VPALFGRRFKVIDDPIRAELPKGLVDSEWHNNKAEDRDLEKHAVHGVIPPNLFRQCELLPVSVAS